jgi:hypothetical protein
LIYGLIILVVIVLMFFINFKIKNDKRMW